MTISRFTAHSAFCSPTWSSAAPACGRPLPRRPDLPRRPLRGGLLPLPLRGCHLRHRRVLLALDGPLRFRTPDPVQSVMIAGSVTRARVSFRTVGVKTLVLEYAKLVRVQA